jgi:hypothetical protein
VQGSMEGASLIEGAHYGFERVQRRKKGACKKEGGAPLFGHVCGGKEAHLEQGCKASTHLAVQEGHKPSSSRHIYKELQSIQSWVAIVPGSLVFISLLYSCFEISKYIHLSLTGFPHGGFFQGHVDQKHDVFFCHACLVIFSLVSC